MEELNVPNQAFSNNISNHLTIASNPHQHTITNVSSSNITMMASNMHTHTHKDYYMEEISDLKQQFELLKRILLVKNIFTEEELKDILNSINVEKKLIKKNE